MKATFQKLYAARDKAAGAKDDAALFATYSPDFVNIDTQGSKDDLPAAKRHFAGMESVAAKIVSSSRVRSVALSGNTATVVVSGSVRVALTNPRTGNPAVFQNVETDRDTWVKSGRGWLETVSKALTEQFTVDGRPVPAHAAPGADPSSA